MNTVTPAKHQHDNNYRMESDVRSPDQISVTPFLKWAGGKRWFVKNHAQYFPTTFGRYLEPFLGSGAVYFYLKPPLATLGDINSELINVYAAIRERPDLVARYLASHEDLHSKDHYYSVRSSDLRSRYARAARTIYLNRTCWNALYRVNRRGEFNVPIGTKNSVCLPTDDFRCISKLLSGATLIHGDFEQVIEQAEKNDFVFVDPPYTVNHNLNGFLKYNEKIFSWDDQKRLRDAVENAARRGAKVLVTNADHSSINQLYSDFTRVSIERPSVIAAASKYRGRQTELVIKCW